MAEARSRALITSAVVGRRTAANGLFVAPYMLIFLVLLVTPLFLGIWLSAQDYHMLGGYSGPVGWENFQRLFDDRIFIGAIWNTLYFVLLVGSPGTELEFAL